MSDDGPRMSGERTDPGELIRDDIAFTRARMGDTLEELGTRLRPERLTQQAKDKLRDATVGRVESAARDAMGGVTTIGRRAVTIVRQKPIPVALLAAGIGWLVVRSRTRSRALPRRHSPSRRRVALD